MSRLAPTELVTIEGDDIVIRVSLDALVLRLLDRAIEMGE